MLNFFLLALVLILLKKHFNEFSSHKRIDFQFFLSFYLDNEVLSIKKMKYLNVILLFPYNYMHIYLCLKLEKRRFFVKQFKIDFCLLNEIHNMVKLTNKK